MSEDCSHISCNLCCCICECNFRRKSDALDIDKDIIDYNDRVNDQHDDNNQNDNDDDEPLIPEEPRWCRSTVAVHERTPLLSNSTTVNVTRTEGRLEHASSESQRTDSGQPAEDSSLVSNDTRATFRSLKLAVPTSGDEQPASKIIEKSTNKEPVTTQIKPYSVTRVRSPPSGPHCSKDFIRFGKILLDKVVKQNLEFEFGLMDDLIAEKVLTPADIEDMDRDNIRRKEKIEILLQHVSDSTLETFLELLRKNKQSHVAAFIKNLGDPVTPDTPDADNHDWPLAPHKRSLIRTLYMHLVEDISTDDVVDYLFSENCINKEHMEAIRKRETSRERNRVLLDIMERRSSKDFKVFIDALKKYHRHLTDFLNKFNDNGQMTVIEVKTNKPLTEDMKQEIAKNHDETKGRIQNFEFSVPHIMFSEGNMYLMVNEEKDKLNEIVQSPEKARDLIKALGKMASLDLEVESVRNTKRDKLLYKEIDYEYDLKKFKEMPQKGN